MSAAFVVVRVVPNSSWMGQDTARAKASPILFQLPCHVIEDHCKALCQQQWDELCESIDGQMRNGKSWGMLKHLLDESGSKSNLRHTLARALHEATRSNTVDELAAKLTQKYLPVRRDRDPSTQLPDYRGPPRPELDEDFSIDEVKEEEARRSIGSDLRTAPSLDTLGSPDVDPGECEPSPSASLQQTTNSTRLRSIPRLRSLPAAEASTALPALAPDPGVEGASQSSEVHHSYQLRSRTRRPPNAFMLVAHGKRQSVAAENPNENNQCVSSRLGKLWRSLSVADKQPYQRKAAAAAAVHRRKHPDYVYNPREAQWCKMQARRAKAMTSKLKNAPSGDQEQQPSIFIALAQDRGTPKFQQQRNPPPPPQRNGRRATRATRGSASGSAKGMTRPRQLATVVATVSTRTASRRYKVHLFFGHLKPSQMEANSGNGVPTTHSRRVPEQSLIIRCPPHSWTTKMTTCVRARGRSTRAESGRR
ncbi:uncharacterized protein [Dermacentor albipictus]|uniref:uncharacterized protein n=1 Tax=Dermacentor albipictus TaxID=60249 RepID=UPI0038FC740C